MELIKLKQDFEEVLIESLKKSFDILRELLSYDSDFRNDLLSQNQRFEQNEKHYRTGKIEENRYTVMVVKVFEGLKDILDQIGEDDLKENWIELDVIKTNFPQEIELGEDDSEDDVSLQDLTKRGIDAIILTETKGINKEIVIELETLILNCQDALGVEKYQEALDYCLEAKKLDFKSPQIYEYLALIHFKKDSPKDIIDNVINGNGEKFKHIIQFTKRFHQFEDHYKSNFATLGEENIKNIGKILASNLRNKYWKLQKKDKDSVWRCIQSYKQVFDVMLSPLVFLERVLIELSGGGTIDWLKINNNNIVNRWSGKYDALSLRKEFMQRLADYYKEEKPELSAEEALEAAETRIKNNFFRQINKEYNKIRQEKNTQGRYRWNDDHWLGVMEFIQASKIGYFLFDDEKFLVKPFEELQHRGKKFMPWTDISPSGKLRTFFRAKKLRFDAITELKFFSEKLGHDFEQVRDDMKAMLFKHMEDKARKKYTSADGRKTNSKTPNLTRIREDVIYSLESFLILYKNQYSNLKDQYLEIVTKEFTGNGILDEWIIVHPDGELETGVECKNLKFKAKRFLFDFLRSRPLDELKEKITDVDEPFFEDLFTKSLNSLNDINNTITGQFDDDWEPERTKIIAYLKNMELCFLAVPDKKYLLPAIDEIFHKNKLFWISNETDGEMNLPICNSLKFDAIGFKNRIIEMMKNLDENYQEPIRTKTDDILDIFKVAFSSSTN